MLRRSRACRFVQSDLTRWHPLLVQAVCRSWSRLLLPTDKTERIWKSLYLRDWEIESANDAAIIATAGEQTPWAHRYCARAAVHRRWNGETKELSVKQFRFVKGKEFMTTRITSLCFVGGLLHRARCFDRIRSPRR